MTVATATLTKVPNYVNGQWIDSNATEWLDVTNPATGEVIAQTPLSSASEVAAAIEAAASAFPEWRRTPAEDRIQPLFKLKHILEAKSTTLPASSPPKMARLLPKPKPSCAARSKTWKLPAGFRR